MTNYIVQFYELINYGGIWESNGTTIVSGYEEQFYTEDKEAAIREFEDRKKCITIDNKLGVTLGTWEDDDEIEQVDYSSETIHDEEQNEKIINEVDWEPGKWGEKNECRKFIKENNKYISMKPLLKDLGIHSNNYFLFMSGENGKLSLAKCKQIMTAIASRPIGKKDTD